MHESRTGQIVNPQWYAIIDCAQDPRLSDLAKNCADRVCLFKGRDLEPELLAAAPWLVRIDPAEPLLPTWQKHGQSANWGIMLQTALGLDELRKRLRRFLQVKLPDGTIALFRFYDPRVFNTYIRAATAEERTLWFDDILQYSAEATAGTAMHNYRLIDGTLFDNGLAIVG